MSELKDLLTNIKEEKREKIIPENIKAGVKIFDIEGKYKGEQNIKVENATLVINEANIEGGTLLL